MTMKIVKAQQELDLGKYKNFFRYSSSTPHLSRRSLADLAAFNYANRVM